MLGQSVRWPTQHPPIAPRLISSVARSSKAVASIDWSSRSSFQLDRSAALCCLTGLCFSLLLLLHSAAPSAVGPCRALHSWRESAAVWKGQRCDGWAWCDGGAARGERNDERSRRAHSFAPQQPRDATRGQRSAVSHRRMPLDSGGPVQLDQASSEMQAPSAGDTADERQTAAAWAAAAPLPSRPCTSGRLVARRLSHRATSSPAYSLMHTSAECLITLAQSHPLSPPHPPLRHLPLRLFFFAHPPFSFLLPQWRLVLRTRITMR